MSSNFNPPRPPEVVPRRPRGAGEPAGAGSAQNPPRYSAATGPHCAGYGIRYTALSRLHALGRCHISAHPQPSAPGAAAANGRAQPHQLSPRYQPHLSTILSSMKPTSAPAWSRLRERPGLGNSTQPSARRSACAGKNLRPGTEASPATFDPEAAARPQASHRTGRDQPFSFTFTLSSQKPRLHAQRCSRATPPHTSL